MKKISKYEEQQNNELMNDIKYLKVLIEAEKTK